MLTHERELWQRGVLVIAGVDEVGAGPLAGPVVAAAVILPVACSIAGVDASKRLTARQRQRLARIIRRRAVAYALGSCSVDEIDRLNILQASRQAMRRAIEAFAVPPQFVLSDARQVPDTTIPQRAIVHGDALSQSIAAASILAKVHRDRLMERLGARYPGYGFEQHRGYCTARHMAALKRLGPTPVHRRSFAPVTEAAELTIDRVMRA